MSCRRWAALAAWIALAAACRGEPPPARRLRVMSPPDAALDLGALRWTGPARALGATGPRGRELEVAGGRGAVPVTLHHPDACDQAVTLGAGEGRREVVLTPRVAVGDQLQLGFGAPFELRAELACDAPGALALSWRQVAGPALEVEVVDDGRALRGRTQPLAALYAQPLPWGIVPLSPRTRGEYVFEVTARGEGVETRARATVSAAARASGVPSVGLGHRLVLGGDAWRIVERPRDGAAELAAGDGATELTPDAVGRWQLEDGAGRGLMLRVGRYDRTPLDCGREECHPSATTAARSSLMTTVLARGLSGGLGADHDPRCTRACHTVGEPGVADGGFAELQRAMSIALPARSRDGAWDELPRALRRLGGVGCTGCHGPAAIPLPGAAASLLRGDVCAVCHDAPPRYGQVVAWRGTRMARADRDPRTREGTCARCHTSAGFVAWQRRVPADAPRAQPPGTSAMDLAAPIGAPPPYIETGVACAACHDPHGEGGDAGLLRRVDAARWTPDVPIWRARKGAVCVPCHAPAGDDGVAASAAAIALGRGGLRAASGEPVVGKAPHGAIAGGCLGCHGTAARPELERGGAHAFAVDRERCGDASCHATAASRDGARASAELQARARRVLGAIELRLGLAPTAADAPPHATPTDVASDTPAGRAYRNALLVVEDPGAAYHDAAYARALLDDAEGWLATRATASP